MTDPDLKRVIQTLELLEREIKRLQRTRQKLFSRGPIDAAWVAGISSEPDREDLVESFAAKFNRLQDTLGDKLLPRFFQWQKEKALPFMDNLKRAERLGLIRSMESWLQACNLRNKLVHEYVTDPGEFAQALNLANALIDELLKAKTSVQEIVESHKS